MIRHGRANEEQQKLRGLADTVTKRLLWMHDNDEHIDDRVIRQTIENYDDELTRDQFYVVYELVRMDYINEVDFRAWSACSR